MRLRREWQLLLHDGRDWERVCAITAARTASAKVTKTAFLSALAPFFKGRLAHPRARHLQQLLPSLPLLLRHDIRQQRHGLPGALHLQVDSRHLLQRQHLAALPDDDQVNLDQAHLLAVQNHIKFGLPYICPGSRAL